MASSTQENIDTSIKDAFKEGGLSAVEKVAKENIHAWKKVPVEVGITGRSGAGKSSFINAYRGIKYDDEEGAADTGVTQTTMEATPYPDPDNPNIVLYDLPGVGTSDFPKCKYLEDPRVGLKKYDFIIIITATRFSDDDLWLYNEMTKLKKPAFLIRSKVLIDVQNLKKKRKYRDEETEMIIADTKRMYREEVMDGRLPTDAPVYFIDNHEPEHPRLDFPVLIKDITDKLPIAKREAILFSMRLSSSLLIKEKIEYLQNRRKYVALCSATVALIPIPGASFSVDSGLIKSEIEFYKTQLGFGARVIEKGKAAKVMEIIKDWATLNTTLIASLCLSEGIEDTAKIVPVLGSIIASCVSAGCTYFVLGRVLTKIEKDALELNRLLVEDLMKE